jgi:WD40 repeat protein
MLAARRILALFSVVAVFTLAMRDDPLVAQGAKDKANPKAKGSLLAPEPLEINQGDALSARALVPKPAFIKGAKSWTLETKKHRWQALVVALSPDGHTVATGGYDGIVRLWEAASGKFLRAFVGHGSYVYGLAFSPDGSVLASSGSWDGTVRIWNLKTGMTLRTLKKHKGYTAALAWSPDGETLVVTGGTSGFATFWDPVLSKQLRTVEHGTPVTSVAYAPDGRTLACGCSSATFLWKAENGDNITTLKQDGNIVYSVAWSPDSKQLLTGGGKDCTVWQMEDTKKSEKLTVAGQAVTWSPDGKYFITNPGGGATQIWDAKKLTPLSALNIPARSFAWTKDGSTLYALYTHDIHACDVAQAKVTKSFTVAAEGSIIWTPGRPLVAGIGETALSLYETATGKPLGAVS